jgi:hypothetical protein
MENMFSFLNKLVNYNFSSIFIENLYIQHLFLYIVVYFDFDISISYNTFINYINTLPQEININTNLQINISIEDYNNIYYELKNNDLINEIKNNDLINILYIYYLNNKETKQYIKHFNYYYTELKYINYINNLISNIQANKICNLFSGFGKFLFNNYDLNNKYVVVDENKYVLIISYINFLIKNIKPNNLIFKLNNIIYDDININNFDLVIADIPDDIRNLIYSNCNSKIKALKIRGTKSEPLIIQYITQIINNNGNAIVILPNSFLFGDSKQHIETRNYISKNFSIQVIDLDNKKSILYLTKKKSFKIIFKSFDNSFETEVDIQNIIENNYSFYYYNYIKNKPNLYIYPLLKLENFINIILNKSTTNLNNNEYLFSLKNNIFKIDKYNQTKEFDHVYVTKNNELYKQDYLNYELKYLFESNIKNIIKGKTNQININKILELELYIPLIEDQNRNIEFNQINFNILFLINKQINILEEFKKKIIIQYTYNSVKIKLLSIVDIDYKTNEINTIYIQRNSNNAGYVNLTQTSYEENTNNYFLKIINPNILKDYLYYILLFYEDEFIKLANKTKTIALSKKNIENIEIPIIDIKQQQHIINKITHINDLINTFSGVNEKINYFSFFN